MTGKTKYKIAIVVLYSVLVGMICMLISRSHMGLCDPGAGIALLFYTPFIAGTAFICSFLGRRKGHSIFKSFAIINWFILTTFVFILMFSI